MPAAPPPRRIWLLLPAPHRMSERGSGKSAQRLYRSAPVQSSPPASPARTRPIPTRCCLGYRATNDGKHTTDRLSTDLTHGFYPQIPAPPRCSAQQLCPQFSPAAKARPDPHGWSIRPCTCHSGHGRPFARQTASGSAWFDHLVPPWGPPWVPPWVLLRRAHADRHALCVSGMQILFSHESNQSLPGAGRKWRLLPVTVLSAQSTASSSNCPNSAASC